MTLRVKDKRLLMEVSTAREISEDEMMQIVAFYYHLDPERAKKVFAAVELVGGAIHCPFPNGCRYFPCTTLRCDANMCQDGEPDRR